MSAFDRIIGYESQKAELKRYCDVIRNPEKYKALGVNIPTGILLEGEPGLGKSTMAMCFMEECGFKRYTLLKKEGEEITVEVQCNEAAMRYWALQYGPYVEVISPERLRNCIREDILKMAEKYK